MKNIIFVAGIHGVGKTTYCKELSKTLNIQHYSCSNLIRQYKFLSNSNKFAENIDKNQDFLLQSIDTLLKNDETCILDGHFCLLDEFGTITKIPSSTFEKINPIKIILLTNDINYIYNNLFKRDRTSYSKTLLEEFSNSEIEYARLISKKFKIKLEIIDLSK